MNRYESSKLYHNNNCSYQIKNESSLIFIFNPLERNSIELLQNNSLSSPIMILKNSAYMRTSSPTMNRNNLIYVESNLTLSQLNNIFYKELDLYVANTTLILTLQKKLKLMSCSNSTKIELERKLNTCETNKFMPENRTFIYENQCLKVINTQFKVTIKCDEMYSSRFSATLNGRVLEPFVLEDYNKQQLYSCCLNKTFSIEFYGRCRTLDPKMINGLQFNEKSTCNAAFNRVVNVGYSFTGNCLYRVTFESTCNNHDIKFSTCHGLKCEEQDAVDLLPPTDN